MPLWYHHEVRNRTLDAFLAWAVAPEQQSRLSHRIMLGLSPIADAHNTHIGSYRSMPGGADDIQNYVPIE